MSAFELDDGDVAARFEKVFDGGLVILKDYGNDYEEVILAVTEQEWQRLREWMNDR